MPKKKEKTESPLNPEISRELHKLQFANQRMSRAEKASRHREECSFEQAQRARIKDVQLKILKDEHYDKHNEGRALRQAQESRQEDRRRSGKVPSLT